VELVMQIQLGKTKEKLNRGSQRMPTYTWHTLLIAASNSSLHGYLSESDSGTVASINRVFEYRVRPNTKGTGMIENPKAQRMLAGLQDNYGCAGLEYAKFLGKNITLVKDTVERTHDAVNNAVKGTTDDRFLIDMMAVMICGGKFAQHLGHAAIDLDRMTGFLVEQLQEQRNNRRGSINNLVSRENVERLLADFIAAHRDRMLLTDTIWRTNGRPPAGWKPGRTNETELRGTVVIRAATQDRIVRISTAALAGWLKKERDLGRTEVMNAIKDTIPGLYQTKADLGHGTLIRLTRQDVIELDLSLMPGFFEFN
jgi:hypothetical protein